MKIPPEFIRLIQQASVRDVDVVLQKLNIKFPQKPNFQSNRDYIVDLCNNPVKGYGVISSVYNTKMQIILGTLGSIPGPVGWVANIIDVIFCLLLGDIVGAVISGVSIAFPIFKAGKTATTAVKPLLKMLSPSLIPKAFAGIKERIKMAKLPLEKTVWELQEQFGEKFFDFELITPVPQKKKLHTFDFKEILESQRMVNNPLSETNLMPKARKKFGMVPRMLGDIFTY